ncbi:MAG: RNA methyltransferase [Nitrospirae bacterium]|nr:RNA methyltransferase [Nitrospirota bacterium]
MEKEITSRGNTRVKRWRQLLESRGIRKSQQFLLFGERVVQEILQRQPNHCRELIYPSSWPNLLPAPTTVSHYHLEGPLFNELDIFGTGTPILVCRTPVISEWNPKEVPRGLELMCPLGDPRNIGALLRTVQAFGVQKVILLKEAASPFHPKSTRSASGAVLNVEFAHGPSIQDLNNDHILSTIVAMDASGQDVTAFRWPKNVRILIGEEGQGLPEYDFPQNVAIPMMTGVNSLNAVVAGSIAMYAYRLQYPL